MLKLRFLLVFGLVGGMATSGCRSPLGMSDEEYEQSLRATIDRALAAELMEEQGLVPTLQTTQPASEVLPELAHRREELEALGPLAPGAQPALTLGPDLTGQDQQRVNISLEHAIASAIRRNLGVRSARLEPAITAQDVIIAEAVFDTLLFSNVDFTKLDQQQRVPVINAIPLGSRFAASESYRFETGLRQRFITGGEAFVSTDLTRFRNLAPGITFMPDPAYTAAVNLGIAQPLLRNFGSDVSLAEIRIARNAEQRSIADLRNELLQLTADTERAYWDLVFAWRNLAIAEWLVDVGVEVREILAGRRELDITQAEYSDAVARVEQRRAEVIRAQRQVREASDALKLLINDPQMNIASEAVLYPLDDTIEAPITYNLQEAILTALDNRPELRSAALNIQDAEIRQAVANNQLLPLLDLTAQMSYTGLNGSGTSAYAELGEGDFIDYIVGLAFEWPWGNRAAEAAYRQARLRRSQTVINYRQAVQNVIVDVKRALRDVITNYELILATRSFRVAQAENLRTLRVEQETLASLTPEFLNLMFQRQETLANARQQEIQALVNFDQSLAELYRAMGIGLTMRRIDVRIEDDAVED